MVHLVRQNKKENLKIYHREVKKIRKVVGSSVPIDHVGSTCLPNMYGKNIIDILIGAKDLLEMNKITKDIIDLGYFPGKNRGDIYRFFASTEEETKSGDVHIHLAIISSDRYQDFLILKKYLLEHSNERKAYSDLKRELTKKGVTEREDYKKTKSEYVSSLLDRARAYAEEKKA